MAAPRRLLAALFLVALFGALTGVLITLAVTDGNEDDRGTVVRTGPNLFEDGSQVACIEFHRFCIPHFDDPHEARALYLGDTHDRWRQGGCFVEWRSDYPVDGHPEAPSGGTGAFRGVCSGSTFLSDGTRIFGPSPRDLDEFAVTYHQQSETWDGQEFDTSYLEVDTRTLICGEWTATYPRDEIPDPECELAPPFD